MIKNRIKKLCYAICVGILIVSAFSGFVFASGAANLKNEKATEIFERLQAEKLMIFFVDPLKNKKPKNACENEACLSLLGLIQNAEKSIDFAIYGIGGQDEIFNALVAAQKRGVIVRGVVDAIQDGSNIYPDTDKLSFSLGTVVNDFESVAIMKNPHQQAFQFDITKAIMHNKFFVIDNQYVWSGSTNVSSGCTAYNANNVVLINSGDIAKLYEQEFKQMHEKKLFHDNKQKIENNEGIKLNESTEVSIYFTPIHDPVNKCIKPLIKNARNTIDIEIFYFTHKGIAYELMEAQKRGVKIRIIGDAASAENSFTLYQQLRDANIQAKIENWGGKMHKKSMIVDKEFLVVGSMNWTTSAQYHNDENVIFIKNKILAKEASDSFEYLWDSIPSKWLNKIPKAESRDSINSCYDDVDNNHNGVKNMYEPECHLFKILTPKKKN